MLKRVRYSPTGGGGSRSETEGGETREAAVAAARCRARCVSPLPPLCGSPPPLGEDRAKPTFTFQIPLILSLSKDHRARAMSA